MSPDVASLRDWVPIRVYMRGSEPLVDWCYAGSTRFTQPFFSDTINQVLRRPFSLLFRHQTSLDFLGELFNARPGLAPTGLIFHMSRCGSTLVAQMLAALEANIVISEAPTIDSVIRVSGDYARANGDAQELRLKWMVGALGQTRSEVERHYFIKFDSWNTLDLDLILKAFPAVPWIFLYRNPVEVIVSQMRQRGLQMVPGSIGNVLPGVGLDDALKIPPEEYCARILARICEAALNNAKNRNAFFVNYDQLPGVVTNSIVEHFGVSYTTEEIEQMVKAASFNSKTPQMTFQTDSEEKQADATDAARKSAAEWVEPVYERLEAVRLEQGK